mgnify:CR=1 FL=1
MKNKWVKKSILFLAAGCLSLSMTGCKGKELIDKALEKVHLKTVQETDTQEAEKEVEPEVPVAKPELVTNLSSSVTYKTGDEAAPLTVEATTSDEGEITYQWYQSLTNTNGGGTIIEGATESSYTPSTKEEGTVYYYVVATSTIKTSTNRVTSETAEVIVSSETKEGEAVEGTEGEAAADAEQTPAENNGGESEETPAQNDGEAPAQ